MLYRSLAKCLRGEVMYNEPLAPYTSLGVGGPADVMVVPHDVDDVKQIIRFCYKEDIPLLFLGKGTNILIRDEGFPGIVVRIGGKISDIRYNGKLLEAESGALLSEMIEFSKRLNLSGLEFAIGIPGSLGGAIWVNAGAKTHSIGDRVKWVEVITEDGSVERLDKSEIAFSYRSTSLQFKPWFIWKAALELEKSKVEIIEEKLKYFWQRRLNQPYHLPSAGCVFKNPPGDHAGRLIDACGCKGMRIGDAMISLDHANFMVNLGNAAARDVLALIEKTRERVYQTFGIRLSLEIEIRGGHCEKGIATLLKERKQVAENF